MNKKYLKEHLYRVVTIFPELINDYAKESILGRGQKAGVIKIEAVDLRKYTTDKHHKVDDTPYGGGPGMILKPEPIFEAVETLKEQDKKVGVTAGQVILLDPRGEPFTQKIAQELSNHLNLIFIAGRYEGIDERVRKNLVDRTISVGPYVLSGGELPALTIIEATARLVPGVLGKEESLKEESHSNDEMGGDLEYPQYTKPADFRGYKVPDVLLSGDHGAIKKWRSSQAKRAD